MEKKISKNQKMYPHRFGCSQNHPKAPQWGFLALFSKILAKKFQMFHIFGIGIEMNRTFFQCKWLYNIRNKL